MVNISQVKNTKQIRNDIHEQIFGHKLRIFDYNFLSEIDFLHIMILVLLDEELLARVPNLMVILGLIYLR